MCGYEAQFCDECRAKLQVDPVCFEPCAECRNTIPDIAPTEDDLIKSACKFVTHLKEEYPDIRDCGRDEHITKDYENAIITLEVLLKILDKRIRAENTVTDAAKEESLSAIPIGAVLNHKKKKRKWLGKLPVKCQLCECDLDTVFYDGIVSFPTRDIWAIACASCFGERGHGLGSGKGQKYALPSGEKLDG